MCFEGVETDGPELLQPAAEHCEFRDIDAVEAPLAIGADAHDARLPQVPQMLGDPGLAETTAQHQIPGGFFTGADEFEQAPAAGFGDGFKGCHVRYMPYESYNCQRIYWTSRDAAPSRE